MQEILDLQRKIVPELVEVLEKRYNVLRTIYYNQPIGRRMLASELNLGERVVRNEIDLLKSQNLIEINTPGMTVTKDGQHVLEGLKDFTYYNNADCHYYCTFPSMTNMLTGNEFDFNAISQEWMHASWASDKAITFYQELHNKNYTCNLYSSDIGYVYGSTSNLAGKFDNIVPVEKEVNHYKLTSLLFEMSVYRYVPYIIKPYFEVLTHEFNEVITYLDGMVVLNDNGDFYRQLLSQSLSVDTEMENALILQHLSGTHLPYTLNEEAITVSESSLEQTIQGLMVIIQEFHIVNLVLIQSISQNVSLFLNLLHQMHLHEVKMMQ